MRVEQAPEARLPMVPMEQGLIIVPFSLKEPEAIGAEKSSAECWRIIAGAVLGPPELRILPSQ